MQVAGLAHAAVGGYAVQFHFGLPYLQRLPLGRSRSRPLRTSTGYARTAWRKTGQWMCAAPWYHAETQQTCRCCWCWAALERPRRGTTESTNPQLPKAAAYTETFRKWAFFGCVRACVLYWRSTYSPSACPALARFPACAALYTSMAYGRRRFVSGSCEGC